MSKGRAAMTDSAAMIAVRVCINTSSESIREHAIACQTFVVVCDCPARQRFPHRISAQTRS